MTAKYLLLILLECASYVTAKAAFPGLDAKLYNVPYNFKFKDKNSFHTNLGEKFMLFDDISGVRDITVDFSEIRALDTVTQEFSGYFIPPETGEFQFYLDASMDATFQIGAGKVCSVEAYKSIAIKKVLKTSSKEPLRVKLEKDHLYPIRIAQLVPKGLEHGPRSFTSLSCVSPTQKFINDISRYVKQAKLDGSVLVDEPSDKSFVKACTSLIESGDGYQFRVLLTQGSKKPNLINDVNSPAFIDYGAGWSFENPAQIYGEKVNSRKFAIELNGYLKVKETGNFTLKMTVKGGISIQFGDEDQEAAKAPQILQLISREAPLQRTIELNLVADKFYPVRIVLVNKRARPVFQLELSHQDRTFDIPGIWFHARDKTSPVLNTFAPGISSSSINHNKEMMGSERTDLPPPKPQRNFQTKPYSILGEASSLDPTDESSSPLSSGQDLSSTPPLLEIPREPFLPTRKKFRGGRVSRNQRSATTHRGNSTMENTSQTASQEADLEGSQFSEHLVSTVMYPSLNAEPERFVVPIQVDNDFEKLFDDSANDLTEESSSNRVSGLTSSDLDSRTSPHIASTPLESSSNITYISPSLEDSPRFPNASNTAGVVQSSAPGQDFGLSVMSRNAASKEFWLSSEIGASNTFGNSTEAHKKILTGVTRSSFMTPSVVSATEMNKPTAGSDGYTSIISKNSQLQPEARFTLSQTQDDETSEELVNDNKNANLVLNAEICVSLSQQEATLVCSRSPGSVLHDQMIQGENSINSKSHLAMTVLPINPKSFETNAQSQPNFSSLCLENCVPKTDGQIKFITQVTSSESSNKILSKPSDSVSASVASLSENYRSSTSYIVHPGQLDRPHKSADKEVSSVYFLSDPRFEHEASMQGKIAFEGDAKKLYYNIFSLTLASILVIIL